MTDTRTFVVVGAGQAGRWLALTLRADGYQGRIVWFGDELHRPYERPPLSKAVLKGDVPLAQLALVQDAALAELKADFRPGERVIAIDRERRVVRTDSGMQVEYDALFLANGGRARSLPGLAPHPRVHTLRTYDDALALKAQLDRAAKGREKGQGQGAGRVIVIGGGWIGLEVAASSRAMGCAVTVVEAAPRLCIRTVPPRVSDHLAALHRAQGVDLRIGDGVQAVGPSDQGVTVRLASGATIEGDALVIGIGLIANDQLAADAGIAVGGGVLTDAHGRTSDPHVYAVGDVAHPMRSHGVRLRIESWENAQRQAMAAAKAALGIAHDPDAEGPPWFWSDQYDDNLQLLGLPSEAMQIVERHVPDKRQHVFFFCDGPRVRAVAAVNAGRDIKIARKWMREGRYPELARLSDASVDLNKLPLAAAG
jgi:3-phenylpropionate/trans-cinnamate dioxygenase ferredoxin reductase subunit